MSDYIIRRLLLLPLTLFCIILVNFLIINLAPGDPTTVTEITQEGMASRSEKQAAAAVGDERYLQFREHYGLTLPIFLNTWPYTSFEEVLKTLSDLLQRDTLSITRYNQLRISFGDRSRYIMPQLLAVLQDRSVDEQLQALAASFFVRGGTRQGYVGLRLTGAQRNYNKMVATSNDLLRRASAIPDMPGKLTALQKWYEEYKEPLHLSLSPTQKLYTLLETRFVRYLSRVITLDFGTLRNDSNKSVIGEVVKRFKYSLTLAFIPLIITFFLSQVFGLTMAHFHNRPLDLSLNFLFLILYAIPIFVVAPFLIEKIALNHTFPFTRVPIPLGGFTSPEAVYGGLSSGERLLDIAKHLVLPLTAIMYGSLAASTRLSRTAVLEVLRQDYVRTARAKGLSFFAVMVKHVGRNASITITTSLASSLGVVLGGSLIVETLFEIDGFGKFFYDAILNRDYNVIMFSAIAGSFLSLVGYLMADVAYTLLDPRVSLE